MLDLADSLGAHAQDLADLSQRLGHYPQVILAGRAINDGMGDYVAKSIGEALASRGHATGARILVLGLTFKENVPDLRNSRVIDIVRGLERLGHKADVYDPLADAREAREEYGVCLLDSLSGAGTFTCIVGAVAHRCFLEMSAATLSQLVAANGLIADVKGMWRTTELPATIGRWSL